MATTAWLGARGSHELEIRGNARGPAMQPATLPRFAGHDKMPAASAAGAEGTTVLGPGSSISPGRLGSCPESTSCVGVLLEFDGGAGALELGLGLVRVLLGDLLGDGAPKPVLEKVSKEDAEKAKAQLEAAGATVELK